MRMFKLLNNKACRACKVLINSMFNDYVHNYSEGTLSTQNVITIMILETHVVHNY